MFKAVVLETDTIINYDIRTLLIQNNIEIIKLNNLYDYKGDADFVLEFSEETTLNELNTFISRVNCKPVILGETQRLLIREISPTDYLCIAELYLDFPEAFSNDCGILSSEYKQALDSKKQLLINYFDHKSFPQNISSQISSTAVEIQQYQLQQYIKFQYGFYGYGLWLLSLKDDPETIVGIAGLYGADPVMISYGILSKYRGKKYCTEAINFILDSLSRFSINKVHAHISIENLSSIAIAQKYPEKIIINHFTT